MFCYNKKNIWICITDLIKVLLILYFYQNEHSLNIVWWLMLPRVKQSLTAELKPFVTYPSVKRFIQTDKQTDSPELDDN